MYTTTLFIFKNIEIYSDKYTKQTVSFSDGASFLEEEENNQYSSKWIKQRMKRVRTTIKRKEEQDDENLEICKVK